ncbi:MAG: hypothetical protein HY905_13300 [Deltaproteobacteria bacterium]|nr:hypothetical protein [Deltaproteobacteria bacterium]
MKHHARIRSLLVVGSWTVLTACTVDRGESINAGAGLLDEEGAVAVDPSQVPVVTGCDENEFVRMGAGGVWECAGVTSSGGGDITGVAAGDGLSGGGTTGEVSLGVDAAAVPIVDSCAEGEYVRLGAAGIWECGELPPPATGDITGVAAGTGLTGGGTGGDVTLEVDPALVPMVGACATGEFVRSAGSGAWECAAVTSSAGGDITAVTAGEGLSGGGDTGDVSLDLAFGGDGTAPFVARADHSHPYLTAADLAPYATAAALADGTPTTFPVGWNDLSGIPASFPASAHGHGSCTAAQQVTGVAAGGTVSCAENALPWRYRYALEVSTVDTSQVTVRSGRCRDKDDTMNIVLAAADTASMATAADRDFGSESADTWYWVWIIADSTDSNTPRAFLSTSRTAPTYPAGFDRGRLLGAVRNDSSSNLWPMQQSGRSQIEAHSAQGTFYTADPTPTSWTPIGLSGTVPPGTEWMTIRIQHFSSTNVNIDFRDPDLPSMVGPTWRSEPGPAYVFPVPVGGAAGSERLEFLRSDAGSNLNLALLSYEWGPQEP